MNELIIQLKNEHFVEFQKYTFKSIKQRDDGKNRKKIDFRSVLLWTAIVFLTLCFYTLFEFHFPTFLFTLVVFFLTFAFFAHQQMKLASPLKDGIILGQHTLKLSEEGVFEESALKKSHFSWESIVSVEQSKNLVYLYVDKAMAILIPKDSFDNKGAIESFISEVKNHLN